MAHQGKPDNAANKGFMVSKYNQSRWNEAIDPSKRHGGRTEKKGPMPKVPRDAELPK